MRYRVIIQHYSQTGDAWYGTWYLSDSIPDVLAQRTAYPQYMFASIYDLADGGRWIGPQEH